MPWDAVTPAGPVPKEAIRWLKAKGLKPSFSYRDTWKLEHERAFSVAGVMREDILKDIRDSLARALEEGQTFAAWKKGIAQVLAEKGWWGEQEIEGEDGRKRTVKVTPHRLQLVYDTNMRTARARGQWERIQRTKDVTPYLEYNLGPSERHRPHHAACEGTVLPVDDPFWSSGLPPNGFRCKCWVRALTESAAEGKGGVTAVPASPADEGWAGNPGAV